jgi:hypothetical protein
MNNNLALAILLAVLSQVVIYFQLQSQFIFDWAKRNWLLLSLAGIPISIALNFYTQYCAAAFGGETWPGRLIGFALGAIVFALLSYFVMREPMTAKTITCLILATTILIIQIFWK